MTRRLLLAVAWVLAGTPAAAQESVLPAAVRAAAEGITTEQIAADVSFLASDELLGRNTLSPGYDQAARYIAERLERAGLEPLGDDGTYFQHYDVREDRVDTTAAAIEIGGRTFRFGEGFVFRSVADPLAGELRVVYVEHGWVVPGEGIDPYGDLDVRGKILLVHGPVAMPKGVEIRQIGRIYVGAITPFEEALRRGAAGILFVPRTEALASWDQMRRLTGRFEMEPVVPSAYAAIPVTSAVLSAEATEALLAGERIGGAELIARGDSADYAPSFELDKTVTLSIPVATTRHRSYNVVARLEGGDSALREEYVTIASHLDGAVGTAVVDGDSIYNAADDNASGSAGNLAIAEQTTKAPRPARSIVFIWDSGEERGLWGTRRFVHDPPMPLASIAAHVNVDMIGANRGPGTPDSISELVTESDEVYLTGPGVLSATVDSLLVRVNREHQNLRFRRDRDRPDHEAFYPRTDAGPFLERGVLTIGFHTGLHDRYHRPADEVDTIDPEKIATVARTIFTSLWALADARERPRVENPIPATVPRYR